MYLPMSQSDGMDWACIPGSHTGILFLRAVPAVTMSAPCFLLSQIVTISPAVLTVPEGDKATFFCNVSMENDTGSEYSLIWYKETNHSQGQKAAEISRYKPMTETEKYRFINHTPVFEIEILNLHQNDSGSYYCVLITFFKHDKVMESSRSQLMVTGQPGGLS